MMQMENQIKMDNGWFHISDVRPKNNEEVLAIFERESMAGCTCDFEEKETIYKDRYPVGHFEGENDYWRVTYWRKKERFPYPSGVVKKEIEECRKHNVSPYKIIEYQRQFGIETEEV